MGPMIYANENDPKAAHWLSRLPLDFHQIDSRSIEDVRADEIEEFTQCHFFAGIGGWSYALQLAGWPIDAPVWTGSCPCQPFSSAGKQRGEKDERHLWPEWFSLIRECRPPIIFGEQVAGAQVVGKVKSKGSEVRPEVSEEAPSQGVGEAREDASIEKGAGVQSGRPREGYPSTDRQGCLRSDGTVIEPGQRKNVGQSVFGSDRARERIFVFEHSSGLPWREHGNGRVGREYSYPNGDGPHGPTTGEVERLVQEIGERAAKEFEWPWLSRIQTDLERAGYTVGSCVLPACSVGSPHIRQRLFWVAYDDSERFTRWTKRDSETNQFREQAPLWNDACGCSDDGGLGHTKCELSGRDSRAGAEAEGVCKLRAIGDSTRSPGSIDGMGNAANDGEGSGWETETAGSGRNVSRGSSEPIRRITSVRRSEAGFWRGADYLYCSDGKYRPVEPGTFPLAHGVPGRVAQLRGLGNAIVPQLAAIFIRSSIEALGEICQ